MNIIEKKQSICLNMIVKNESRIIVDTLTKLLNKIKWDYWVICDTGSTDNTRELITEFFEKQNIPGELFCDEWKDFGHNRTEALKKAFDKTDYVLVEQLGQGQIGFTWDTTTQVLTTNESKPVIPA